MEIAGKIGSVLQGRYRITGFLGRGGMGAVYQCEDLRLPGKRWAVKEMLVFDPTSQEQIEESFKREAQMLSRLRHRNLPMIVDYFIEESRQYLVMECIEGENLAHLIQREGQASELQAMRWALELAQVLDYLHRQEKPVIFRDLKPDNIIVTEDRHIKLVDFGLARQFDPGKRRDTQVSGSVGYASPEQWEDAGQTDERSDVYSLGATLFYVLTGRPPSPVYGSQRLRPFRPGLDSACEAVVLKCLQPEPSQRYANSGELIRDLLLWLSRQPALSGTTESSATTEPTSSGRPVAAVDEDLPAFVPVAKRRLTPGGLLWFLQVTTFFFLLASVSGLVEYWIKKNPLPPALDPLRSILTATANDKVRVRGLMQSKQYSKAIDELDKLITRYPEDAEAQILSQNAYVIFQKKPYYKIPVMTSTVGNDREGVQFYPGLAMAQRQVNQRGGVRGHLLYLDLFDTASRPDQAIEMASNIAHDPAYQIVLGPWTSQQVIATAPVFEGSAIPALAPTASDPRVWEIGKHIFTASDSDLQRVECIARYMWGQGWKTVAVFTAQDSIVSRSESDEFKEAFSKLGGKIVAPNLPYDSAAPDFADQLQILNQSSVEAVFLAEYRSDIVLQFAHLLRKNYPKLPLATQVVAFSGSIVLNGGKDVDGMLTSTYFHPDAGTQRIHDFTSNFAQQFGSLRPSHREANAYDSLILIADGIEKVGFDRGKLTEYLQQIGSSRPPYPGVSGDFAPGRRLDRRKPYLVEIKDGQYQLLGE